MQESSGPAVDLVIVNYRSYDELTRCLSSLESSRASFNHVTVVDHDSERRAAERVRARFPWVTLVERSTNDGFATGVNLGVRRSTSPFLLLLNPDCVASGAAIDGLVRFANDHPDAAIIGPRILDADGSVQGSARRFPGLTTMFAGRSSWLTRHFPNNPLSRWNLPLPAENGAPMDVDWVSGACMLVRRAAFDQVDGMDERFFLYWEDADFCRRLTARGWRIVYFPAVTIMHVGGRSSMHAYRESLAAFHASAFMLFRKHAARPARWLAPLVYLALQARLRTLLVLHRQRLTTTRLPRPEQSPRS